MKHKEDGSFVDLYPTANMANVTGSLALASGGTGATTAEDARTNLGLGTIATYASTDYVESSRIWTGTQAEYDAIETKSSTTIYYITD